MIDKDYDKHVEALVDIFNEYEDIRLDLILTLCGFIYEALPFQEQKDMFNKTITDIIQFADNIDIKE